MQHSLDLTLYLIVKNEEIHLEQCLSSFQGIWKNLLIVDTGSTDRTKEIATKYGARILDFEWIKDFSAARNFALENIESEWVMMVDADDIIEEDDKAQLIDEFSKNVPKHDVTMMAYIYHGDKNNQKLVHYFPRIWKAQNGYRYHRPIHEALDHNEKGAHVQFLEIPIIHAKKIDHRLSIDRNLEMLNQHLKQNPQDDLSLLYLGLEYQDLGDLETANQYFQKCIEAKPSDLLRIYEVHTRRGVNHMKLGKIIEARQDFEKAISTNTGYIEPYLYLAEIEMNLFSPDRAIQLLNIARLLKPPKTPFAYDISHYYGFADRLLTLAQRKKLERTNV